MRFGSLLVIVGLVFAVVWLPPRPSEAVPAFARKHSFSCTTCHAPFPRLKEYGEEFAGNAFAPSDREMPPRYFRDVGDDSLKLLKDLPLAIRADMYFDIRTDEDKGDGFSDFKAPWGLKLLSGGRIGDDIGYYFYFYMNERGEVAGVEDAYIHFNDLFGTPIDLMLGQFQVSDPLFKRELRLTFQDYLCYKIKPGLSLTNLTYDRGIMLTTGFDFGLDIAAIVVNGNGKGDADLRTDFDIDRYKNYLLRLSQSIGPLRLGFFGYYGKEELVNQDQKRTNELTMWGPDLTVSFPHIELNFQYLQRRDLNPSFLAIGQDEAVVTHGLLAEVIIELSQENPGLYVVLLANYVDSEEWVDALGNTLDLGEEAYTANLTYLVATNIKLLVEYTFANVVHGETWREHRATLGVVTGF